MKDSEQDKTDHSQWGWGWGCRAEFELAQDYLKQLVHSLMIKCLRSQALSHRASVLMFISVPCCMGKTDFLFFFC